MPAAQARCRSKLGTKGSSLVGFALLLLIYDDGLDVRIGVLHIYKKEARVLWKEGARPGSSGQGV